MPGSSTAAGATRQAPRCVPELKASAESIVADAALLGVALETRQAELLLQFGALLLRWNQAFNLVSRRDTGRLVSRHLLDSLSIAPWLQGPTVMDLGTGAGLPGVPLAIAREELRFTLVDRSERKIRFVDQAIRTLALSNVTGWCGDVRALPESATYDTVVSRAVAAPPEIWALAGPRLRPGGRLLIMHRGQTPAGSGAGGAPAAADGELTGGIVRERVWLPVPGLEQPHELMVLEREKNAS
jgi:16S rRNA (guanine527-N7)-methyltransferase